jgi:hypothetical protein
VYVTGEALCAALNPASAQDTFAGAFILAVPKAALYTANKFNAVNVAVYTDLQVKASADSRGGGGGGPTQWVQLQPARPQTAADAAGSEAAFAAQVGGAVPARGGRSLSTRHSRQTALPRLERLPPRLCLDQKARSRPALSRTPNQNADESGDYNTMVAIKITGTSLLASMTQNVGTAPMLRAHKFGKGIAFARPGGAMVMPQPGGGVPIEMEVPGAFRVSSVSALSG